MSKKKFKKETMEFIQEFLSLLFSVGILLTFLFVVFGGYPKGIYWKTEELNERVKILEREPTIKPECKKWCK